MAPGRAWVNPSGLRQCKEKTPASGRHGGGGMHAIKAELRPGSRVGRPGGVARRTRKEEAKVKGVLHGGHLEAKVGKHKHLAHKRRKLGEVAQRHLRMRCRLGWGELATQVEWGNGWVRGVGMRRRGHVPCEGDATFEGTHEPCLYRAVDATAR